MGSSSSARGLPCASDSSRRRARAVSAGYRLSSKALRRGVRQRPELVRPDAGMVEEALLTGARGRQEPEPGAGGPAGDERQHHGHWPGPATAGRRPRSGSEWRCPMAPGAPAPRGRPPCGPVPRARETRRHCAAPCAAASPSRLRLPSSRGNSNWCRAAKLTFASNWAPVARSSRSPAGGGIRRGRLDQGGLADAGLPGHHERAAVRGGLVDERADDRDVPVTSHQVVSGMAHPAGPSFSLP